MTEETRAQIREFGSEAGNPETSRLSAGRMNAVNPEYYADLQALLDKYAERPAAPAYVLNLNPYPLRLNSPRLQNIIIPACQSDEEFVSYKFTGVDIEMKLTGDGKWTPVPFEPYTKARAYYRQQQDLQRGGVIWYEGDKDPLTDPKLQEQIAVARREMEKFAREKKQEADNEWNTPSRRGARNINELHRGLTLYLMREGHLEKAPEWLDRTLVEANKGAACPSCKTTPERDAVQCKCGYFLDVEGAFDLGMIEEDSVHLRRLSRERLEELNLSEYVAETLEERRARLAEEAGTNPDRNLTPQEKAARTRAANAAAKAAQQQEPAA